LPCRRLPDAAAAALDHSHGTGSYSRAPKLECERLAADRRATAVPLSLHGPSGLPGAMVREAIAGGVTKVNVNTELREAYPRATGDALEDCSRGLRVLELHRRQMAAVHALAAAKLELCAPPR
jgi:fructose/tagatose bisphosphate aldolase